MKIEDIALLANVSKSAVSLALNDRPGVSEETRELIKRIARENNYVPQRKSKAQDNTQKKLIRFVAVKTDNVVSDDYQSLPFFNELLSFIMTEIKKYPFILSSILVDENDYINELEDIESKQESDAFIVLGTNLNQNQINDILKIQPFSVIIDTEYPDIDADFISINNYLGAYTAADYLISNGHSNIGYCKGKPRIQNFKKRKEGFDERLRQADIQINEDFIIEFPAMTIENQATNVEELLKQGNIPSAFFCENDYIAISLIKSLESVGLNVPNDISVVGFDDIKESIVISPELTTIRVRKDILAKEALHNICTKLVTNNPNINKVVKVNTDLVIRNSTK